MTINYNVTGPDRKRLVQAIAEHLECDAKYLRVPTCAYQIGCFTVDRFGNLSFDDRADSEEVEQLIEALCERGFEAECSLPDDGEEEPATPAEEDATKTEAPAEKETATETETPDENDDTGIRLNITYPAAAFTPTAMVNLRSILDSKGALIRRALGLECLPVEVTHESVSFPWFREALDPDAARAYARLIIGICDIAQNLKRVTAKEKETDNEKYAFRCFLLRLGFIGDEYKADRKILLRNLSGSSAFKTGKREEGSECSA